MCVCLSVCQHSDVRLTSPPVLKLWGTLGGKGGNKVNKRKN